MTIIVTDLVGYINLNIKCMLRAIIMQREYYPSLIWIYASIA